MLHVVSDKNKQWQMKTAHGNVAGVSAFGIAVDYGISTVVSASQWEFSTSSSNDGRTCLENAKYGMVGPSSSIGQTMHTCSLADDTLTHAD